MAYARSTDFLALLRSTGDGVRFERMPGLDWLVVGMAAAGMFTLWVDPVNPPNSNQTTTVWLKTNSTSFAVEGAVYLWDNGISNFSPASPKLWQRLFAAIGT